VNIGWAIVLLVISFAIALLYRHIMLRTFTSVRLTSSMLVPIEELKNISDYRKFFGFLNKFSQASLNRDMTVFKQLPECSKLGPYHFTMAFANLTEIQRDRFASAPELLNDILSIFSDYNNAIWAHRDEQIANALANFHRKVNGEDTQSPSFFISENFKRLLSEIKETLLNNNILKAHVLLLKEEKNTNLTDLELLILTYIVARLSAFFQGRNYRYSENTLTQQIDELIRQLDKLINNIDKPHDVLCQIPDNSFNLSTN
jgi:hypothetical protein